MQSVLASLAQVSVAAGVITSGRAQSLVVTAVALISVVAGGMAVARPGDGRRRAAVAIAAGLIGLVLAGLHLATATGAIGTGSGRLGAIVALIAALIGTGLGGLALARSRRVA
jgi:hypothetical protein